MSDVSDTVDRLFRGIPLKQAKEKKVIKPFVPLDPSKRIQRPLGDKDVQKHEVMVESVPVVTDRPKPKEFTPLESRYGIWWYYYETTGPRWHLVYWDDIGERWMNVKTQKPVFNGYPVRRKSDAG